MLHKSTVEPNTLDLLKELCSIPELSQFALGGGTSIALQKGHRLSIDLDFFTNKPFELSGIFKAINYHFKTAQLVFEQNQTMMFLINDIKTDFVLYPFEWHYPIIEIEDVRLISVEDIIPMKLQAVSNRFAKKDFWDLERLAEDYTIEEMISIFKKKFPNVDTGFIVHSLTNFEKADAEQDPITIENKTWEIKKKSLYEKVRAYTQLFL